LESNWQGAVYHEPAAWNRWTMGVVTRAS
jgi:hypothetical protein